jgi:hypothetical protein
MCAAPKIAPPQQIPDRQAARLPDNGDPLVRQSDIARRRLSASAMIFSGANGSLGMPSVTGRAPLGSTGTI